MKVILISGKAQHGKDYTANMIKDLLESKDKKVLICHYADLLKYICKTFFNWNGVKDDYGRSILQKVGTDVIRKQNPDYWVEFISTFLGMFIKEWDYVLIPDVRFLNEVEYFIDESDWQDFKVTTVRVFRDNFESNLTEEQKAHISEIALDDFVFDFIIHNDGTRKGLNNEVEKLIEVLINEK